jgi:hypothetical protein
MRHWIRLSLIASAIALVSCGAAEEGAAEPIVADEPPSQGDEGAASSPGEGRLIIGDDACTTDADCVPADCCHAAACVARENAPSCGDAVCTMECRPDTMDCGGGCLCHEGRCAARLAEVPGGVM